MLTTAEQIILMALQIAPSVINDAVALVALAQSAAAAIKAGTVTAEEWAALRAKEAADEAVVNAPIVDSSNV